MTETDTQTDLTDLEDIDDLAALDINELRLDLLDELAAVRQFLYKKTAGNGRVRDTDRASARAGYANAYIRAANSSLRVLEDVEEAQLSERLKRIEDHLGIHK